MEGLELICFKIISSAGVAKSSYIKAIQCAKKGDFEKSSDLMIEGKNQFMEAHKVHSELINKEVTTEDVEVNLLLVHAEDQLISTQTCRMIAEELIECYERITELENKV